MNRTRALLASFFTVRVALLAFGLGFAVLGLPKPASAESDITDDEIVDVTDDFCDPDEGDDCEVESVASILDSTTSTEVDTFYATYITEDLLDYDYYAYVEGYLYQDDVLVGDGSAFDDGSGEAELDGATAINVSGGADAYAALAESYLYDADEDEYYEILDTEADATLGPPDLTSVSPAYAYVGTSGTLTLGGDSLINPFGACDTTVSAVPATSGATGLTLTAGSFNPNQESGTASFTATLTADTGPWDIGMGSCLGSTLYATTTKGLFTVGDPTPSITSVSPSTWTAGQTISVTIKGSGFGSNPTLTVTAAGVTSSITGHSDTGASGGATITANITVGVCTPAETASIVVTSTGYTGAGFTPAFSGQSASGSSSATVTPLAGPTPTITLGSGTANVAGTTQSIVVGQKVVLTSSIGATAFGCLSTQSWSTPTGTSVGAFSVTSTTTGGVTTYTEHLTAAPVIATAASGQSDTFYWTNAGTSRAMLYQYTLTSGAKGSATVTFNVSGPTGGPMTATPGTVNVWPAGTAAGGAATTPWLEFGTAQAGNVGMNFVATATPPSGNTGSFSWVQLVGTNSWQFRTNPTSGTHTFGTGLDNTYPYAGSINNTNDSPGVQLDGGTSAEGEAAETFNATMYVMWTPTASTACTGTACTIPVPLGSAAWSFSGDVTKTLNPAQGTTTKTWIKSCGAAGTVTVTASSSYPVWTNTIHNSE